MLQRKDEVFVSFPPGGALLQDTKVPGPQHILAMACCCAQPRLASSAPPEGRDPAPELAPALDLLVRVGRAARAPHALPLALRRVFCSKSPPVASPRQPAAFENAKLCCSIAAKNFFGSLQGSRTCCPYYISQSKHSTMYGGAQYTKLGSHAHFLGVL